MIWKLTDGDNIFMICDGVGRTYQMLSRLTVDLSQATQVETPSRAQWPVAFPGRASRELHFTLPVTFPPCASFEEAFAQALDVPVQCPRGGVLTGILGTTQRSYSQAWVNTTHVDTIGVTNLFRFDVTAVNPTTATLSPLALMNINEVANLHAITGLVGGTATDLDSLITSDVLPGFQTDVFVAIGALNQLATFRLYEGTDATNTDPDAGPVIVRPVDYATTTNEKVWKRLDA
ncbi:MAG: hypothetical protein WAW39_16080 [Prosthecobacter sp.]|uniref:hypothetical protein n=1 Tax=Prosthecobacter sp. TaxID=1965333 RepID=UPI003BB0EB52